MGKDLIKKKSKEIRERSKSRTRQGAQQDFAGARSFAAAAEAGSEGSTRGQETIAPLTKEETKVMLTVIMSAIVVWALYGSSGTRQLPRKCE